MKKLISVRFFVIAAILCAIVTAGIVYRSHTLYSSECTLYFLNASGTSLSIENRKVVYREENELPAALLKELIKGPESNQNKRVVSKKTRLNSIENDGYGNVRADFSNEFISDDATKTLFSVYSVVKSLCSIDDVISVKVTVEGGDILTADGTALESLTADDINLEIDTDTSETREIKLYFTDSETKKLSEEIRTVRVTDQQPIEQYIINELIKGPQDKGHTAVLSKETTLVSVNIANNIGFVNFGKHFIERNSGNDEQTQCTIFAIVNSMTELESINRVQFLVDGKKTEKLGNIDISHPIGRNNDIIE